MLVWPLLPLNILNFKPSPSVKKVKILVANAKIFQRHQCFSVQVCNIKECKDRVK